MRLSALLSALPAEHAPTAWQRADAADDPIVRGIAYDSRAVSPGDLFVALSGALAICAMVVPGVSGSFVLLLLGKYAYVLDAIGHLRFGVILPFVGGVALGLFSFTRLLSWILHHYERASLLAINGILVASLWVIWPFQLRRYVEVRGKRRLIESQPGWPDAGDPVFAALALAVLGCVIVIVLHRLARRGGHAAR